MKSLLTFATIALVATSNTVFADDSALIEQGIALKAKADGGDADAMMALAELLIKHAPEPKRPYTICDGKFVNPLIKRQSTGENCKTVVDEENQKLIEQWKPVGNRFSAMQWITKAAEAGNRQAIAIKCGPKNDPLAPASMREEAEQWCAKR